jgi:4-hydroxy-tetrahydrodipicolinate synthase
VINVSPELLGELGRIDNVAGVKQANNDELGPIEGLLILAGNDEIFQRCQEGRGAGGILVASHVAGPRLRDLYDAVTEGDLERAREIDAELAPVYEMLTVTSNPIPVKAACQMLGLIPSDRMRLPMVEADEQQRAAVRSALEAQGLLAAA